MAQYKTNPIKNNKTAQFFFLLGKIFKYSHMLPENNLLQINIAACFQKQGRPHLQGPAQYIL